MQKKQKTHDALLAVMRITFQQIVMAALFVSLSHASDLHAQELLNRRVTLSVTHANVETVLDMIARQTHARFVYSHEVIRAGRPVSITVKESRLEQVLETLLQPLGVNYTVTTRGTILLKRTSGEAHSLEIPDATPLVPVDRTLTGKVTDEKGEPLPGVSIVIKGTQKGTVADFNGNYNLQLPDGQQIVVFSFVGYLSEELTLTPDRTRLDIALKVDEKALEEVVVVGYGTQKKASLTGAVANINTDKLPTSSALRVDQMLQGQASGVLVTSSTGAPGAAATIRIRGNNSITAGSEPLFVVDGIIGGGNLNTLNPEDIASIDILKDVSSTGIYGSRGSNGVILITTKRGSEGKSTVNFSMQYGLQKIPRLIEMLNGMEYAHLLNETVVAQGRPPIFDDPDSFGEGTNWQKEITRTAPLKSANLSFSGGNKVRYYISGNYFDQQGIILNSGIKRYQFRVNLDNNLSDKLRIGTSINLGHSNTNNNTTQLAGLAGSALATPPVIPVFNERGEYAFRNPHPDAAADFNNPVAAALVPTNYSKANTLLANFFVEYEPVSGLKLKSSFGTDVSFNKSYSYTPGSLPAQRWAGNGGQASLSQTQGFTWQNENTASYFRRLNENHEFDILGGVTYQQGTSENMSAGARNFATDANTFHNLSTGDPSTRTISSAYSSWNMLSLLGRLNYTFKNRYLLTLVSRYDGSSRLGNNNKFAFFPSAALAWIVSEEDFLKSQNLLSFMKVRTSFGKSGNQAVDIYQTLSTYATTPFIASDNPAIALIPSRLENRNLRWETLTQFDAGLEFGILNNRIKVEADFYHSLTRDLLLNAEIPSQTGFSSMLQNIGKVSNTGFELTIHTINLKKKHFEWETNFNIATNRNEVIHLGDKSEIITHIYNYGQQPAGILRVGHPIGSFFGATTEGLWRSQEEIDRIGTMPSAWPGMRRYKDLNGNGLFEDGIDYAILGNGNPKFFGGLGNTIRYKGFDIYLFFQGTYGNKLFNGWAAYNGSSNPVANQFKDAQDRWTPDNPDSTIPRAGGNNQPEERTPSDVWIFDGSHLRLRTFSLQYAIPLKNASQSAIKRLTVNLTGNNLWLLSSYKKGYDPEVNTFGSNSMLRGYDYAAYPNNRSFTIGVNMGL